MLASGLRVRTDRGYPKFGLGAWLCCHKEARPFAT